MSDTIRDVTLRVSIQAGNTKLSAPDMSGATASLQKLEAAATSIGKAQTAAVQNIATAQKSAWDAGLAGLSALGKRHRDFAAERLAETAAQKKAAESLAATEEAAQKKAEEQVARKGARQAFTQNRRELMAEGRKEGMEQRMFGGGVQAVTGGAHMFRGIALELHAGSENAEEFAKGLEKIQAGFDLMVGTIQTIHGVREALQAMDRATRMTALAQQALALSESRVAAAGGAQVATNAAVAGSNAAVGATAGAATQGLASMSLAMLSNPVTLVLLGIAAAVTAAYAAWKLFGPEAQKALRLATLESNTFRDELGQMNRALITTSLVFKNDLTLSIIKFNDELDQSIAKQRGLANSATALAPLKSSPTFVSDFAMGSAAAGAEVKTATELAEIADKASKEVIALGQQKAKNLELAAAEAKITAEMLPKLKQQIDDRATLLRITEEESTAKGRFEWAASLAFGQVDAGTERGARRRGVREAIGLRNEGGEAARAKIKASATEELKIAEAQQNLAREADDRRRTQHSAMLAIISAKEKDLEISRNIVKAERDRKLSIEESLGAMEDWELQRGLDLIDRIKTGKASVAERKEFAGSALAGTAEGAGVLGAANIGASRARGDLDKLRGATAGAPTTEREAARRLAEEEAAAKIARGKGFDEASLAEARQTLIDNFAAYAEVTKSTFKAMADKVTEMKTQMAKIEADIAKAGQASTRQQ